MYRKPAETSPHPIDQETLLTVTPFTLMTKDGPDSAKTGKSNISTWKILEIF